MDMDVDRSHKGKGVASSSRSRPMPAPVTSQVEDEDEDEVLQNILEDPEEEEEEEQTGTSKKEQSKLKLDHKLPDYDTMRMTAADLHELIHEGYIDLDPEYQRAVVWPDKKQTMLIDSMMNNFYVPAIIFAVRSTWDEARGTNVELRVCMDGKQRLTSMQRFMDGVIPYVHHTGVSYFYSLPSSMATKRKQLLPDKLRKQFAQKAVSCIQYHGISEDDEREIFRRVQMGVALTAAEKLQAIQSPWASFVRMIQKQFIDEDGTLGDSIKWLRKRGVDYSCTAQIIFTLYNLPNFTWPGLTTLDKFLRKVDRPTKEFRQQVTEVFADYLSLAKDRRYNFGFHGISDRVSPVELVMIGLLVGYMKNCRPEEKAYHINHLRKETRVQFKDVRMNDRVTKFMWGYISKIKLPTGGKPVFAVESNGSKKRKPTGRHVDDEYRPAHGRK